MLPFRLLGVSLSLSLSLFLSLVALLDYIRYIIRSMIKCGLGEKQLHTTVVHWKKYIFKLQFAFTSPTPFLCPSI